MYVCIALSGSPGCISCISLEPQAEWSDRLYDRPASAFGDACAFLLPVFNKMTVNIAQPRFFVFTTKV